MKKELSSLLFTEARGTRRDFLKIFVGGTVLTGLSACGISVTKPTATEIIPSLVPAAAPTETKTMVPEPTKTKTATLVPPTRTPKPLPTRTLAPTKAPTPKATPTREAPKPPAGPALPAGAPELSFGSLSAPIAEQPGWSTAQFITKATCDVFRGNLKVEVKKPVRAIVARYTLDHQLIDYTYGEFSPGVSSIGFPADSADKVVVCSYYDQNWMHIRATISTP